MTGQYLNRADIQSASFVEIELDDTPNFHRIDISSFLHLVYRNILFWSNPERVLEIEILEIYPGTRYNHTVINSIMGYHRGGP